MKRWLVALLIAIIATILHLLVFRSPWGERIEPLTLDYWSYIRGSREVPSEVAIVAMDEISYQNLDVPLNQAWPRKLHAELVQRLAEMGVRKVVFDILFIDKGSDPKGDEALAQALKKTSAVLGVESITQEQASSSGTFTFDSLLRPYAPFEKNASLGVVTLPEEEGYIRRFLSDRNSATKGLPSLSEAAVDQNADQKGKPGPRDLINYYGPQQTIPTLSYSQLLDKEHPIPNQVLKDKVVFIGLSFKTDVGPAQKDVFSTPYGRIYGVEIHATAALNLLHKDWIYRASLGIESAILALVSLVLCTLLFKLRPISAGALVLGVEVAWLAASFVGFSSRQFIPGLIFFTAFLPLSYLGSTLYYYFVTRRAQLKMESAFQLYVSPDMARQISANQGSLKLGGEKVWATAMFTDIAGFTSITEELPAEKVSAMLNAYFTEVMDVVFQNQGTLLKFIGDAVFVIWGAPMRINDHATKACQTALAIAREVERFNKTGRFAPLNTRIGLNTGPMVVGNLGSERRFDYTAIGDSVNLASRVEGINKYFGTGVLITESVKKEIGNTFATLCMGSIRVAGKREAVELHALLPEVLPEDVVTQWSAGLFAYRGRRWSDAIKTFDALIEKSPYLRKAAELYRQQIEAFRNAPPPDDWLGEVSFSEK